MLFAAHMAQHLLLIAVAAPLLVLGGVSHPHAAGGGMVAVRRGLPVLALARGVPMGGAQSG